MSCFRPGAFEIRSADLAVHFARLHHTYGVLLDGGFIQCGRCSKVCDASEFFEGRCEGDQTT